MMDTQFVLNLAFGLAGFLGAWVLNSISSAIKDLKTSDLDLTRSVQHIELLVTGTYVKKEDLDKLNIALFKKLDRIEEKLDGKQDK